EDGIRDYKVTGVQTCALPILHWLLADPSRLQDRILWLIFGSRYESDIYYHQEFLQLGAEHPNFQYLPTLSRGGPEWKGLRGYVRSEERRVGKECRSRRCGEHQ